MTKRVRCIIVNPAGKLLLGKNRLKLFNLPGGKIKDGEHPVDALLREVHEETGITKFEKIKFLWQAYDNDVFVMVPKGEPKPTNKNDPDREFFSFGWFGHSELPLLDQYANAILKRYLKTKALAGVVEVLVDGKKVYDLDDDMVWETMPRLVQKQVNEGKKIQFRQVLDDGTVIDKTPEVLPDYMRAKADWLDKLPGGLADDKTPEDFDPKALREGILIELEHTSDKKLAQEITMDHLTEDNAYYVKLKKIEGSGGNTERAMQMERIYDMIDELLLRYIPEEKSRPSAEIVYDVDYMGKTTWKPMGGKNYTHISINHKVVNNLDMLRQVLAHEVIHHHLYQKYGKDVGKHGEHFEMIAERMNAKEGKNFVTEFANQTDLKEGNSH